MTTLIVGCGYLGRRVGARLVEAGDQVFGTTRTEVWANSLRSIGIEPVLLDVLQPEPIRVPDFDRIVYCIGYDRSSGITQRDVYVTGLRRFFEAVPIPGRFVYVSSTGVYGAGSTRPITEEETPEPSTDSGRICLEAEDEARDKGASVARLAGLYGPGRIIRRAAIAAGEPVTGDPSKIINLVQIDDAATAVIQILERGVPGRVYNVVDRGPVSRRDLYNETARLLEAPTPTYGPADFDRSEPGRRISPQRIREELGFEPRYPDFRSGLSASIAAEG